MTKSEKSPFRGGEPDAARLLELARAELLTQILPQLQGDGRYRARLIANALKIATHELEAGAADQAEAARELAAFAATLPSGALPGTGAAAAGAALTAALRAGALDGDPDLHALLARLTDRRRAALG